jgi:hypothetical protein
VPFKSFGGVRAGASVSAVVDLEKTAGDIDLNKDTYDR